MPNAFVNIKKVFLNNIFPLVLILFGVVVAITNYTPGTWQTGWDTLHPEFNFNLNIPRHLFGMWQENQGLGNVGGHSHAADSSRILLLYLFSFFLPLQFLRYFYLYLTLIFGILGTYYFLRNLIFQSIIFRNNYLDSTSYFLSAGFKRDALAFSGALFYLFNLGTVQQYIVQLEMYTVLYAALPWFFLFSAKYLEEGDYKNLIKLFVVCILGAPLAYSTTVFIALFIVLAAFLFGFALTLLKHLPIILVFKRLIFVSLFILGLNLYWLLPSVYFGLKHAEFVGISNVNSQFSDTIFAYNVKYGDIYNLVFINGFLTEWLNYDFILKTNRPIMLAFTKYWENNLDIKVIGYSTIFFIVLGLFYVLFSKKSYAAALLASLFISVFMFLNINPPFGPLYSFLMVVLGVLSEIFRNPYTKFSVQLIFLYSTLFALGVYASILFVEKLLAKTSFYTYFVLTLITPLIFVYYMYPIFTGNFIHKDIRLNVPQHYFELFDWLNTQEDERRVANLPIHSLWGWEYHSWRYQGAGFLWFGMKQPLLARDFDRWNPFNEGYYYDMSHAVYSKDVRSFENTVLKYGVGYILLDKSSTSPEDNPDMLYVSEIEDILAESAIITHARTFGDIEVYKVMDGRINSFYSFDPSEVAYTVEYPFQKGRKFVGGEGTQVYEESASHVVESIINLPAGDYNIFLPAITNYETRIPAKVFVRKNDLGIEMKINYQVPQLILDDTLLFESEKNSLEKAIFVDNVVESAFILGIDNVTFFEISNLGMDYKEIGNIVVDLNRDLTFEIYSSQIVVMHNVLSDLTHLVSCSDGDDAYKIFGDGFLTLLSGDSQSCVYYPLPVSTEKKLYKTNLSFKSELGDYPSYCLDSVTCVSNLALAFPLESAIDDYKEYVDYVSSSNVKGLRLFSKVSQNRELSKASYKDVTVEEFLPLGSAVINANELSGSLNGAREFKISSVGKSLRLGAQISKDVLSYGLSGIDLYSPSETTERKLGDTKKEFSGGGLTLSSIDASIYDSVTFPHIPNDLTYIVNFDIVEKTGFPLNVVVADAKTHRHFVDKSIEEGTVFIVPNGDYRRNPDGYRVEFTNLAIGDIESLHTVRGVNLYPFIGNWLSNIEIITTGQTQPVDFSYKNSVDSKTLVRPFLYKISGLTVGDILVFESSYEVGWRAFGATSHHKVNGWSNGWVVKDEVVYIFFLPTMLQLVGYITVVALFFAILIGYKKHH